MIEGFISTRSSRPHAETLERIKGEIAARNLTIFAEGDHAAGAEAAGFTLRPLFLVIFGSAKGGTPLMQAAATVGIDLPLKLLIWQDDADAIQVSFNDPLWVAKRHELADREQASAAALSEVLRAIVAAALA